MTTITDPIRQIDGILCFTEKIPDDYLNYHVAGLDILFAAEKRHFWFITRRERIINTFLNYLPNNKRVLEIGAGTGYVAEGLKSVGYELAVGDIHLSGLRYAKAKGISDCYQFDIYNSPFREEFDAIGMFDVLEHLEDDVNALQHVSKMLKFGGILFITVPAHQWLWSRNDTIAAHKRRYNRKQLQTKLEQAGFNIQTTEYFFISILPLLVFRRILGKDTQSKTTHNEVTSDIHINYWLNKLLLTLTRIENHCSKWLPRLAGGSLLCVARKDKGTNE